MSSSLRGAIAAILALAIALAALSILPAGGVAARTPLQFGTFTPDDPYNGHTNATNALEASIGRRVDIVNWFQNWGGGDWISKVQRDPIDAVTGSQRTPLLTWEPWKPEDGANQPKYRLARIAGGDFDSYIAGWADRLREVGTTIYLRPMHEMNGNWYPWGGSVNSNTAEQYVRAWRHMHAIFARRGAANVRWVWAPTNVDVPSTPANRLENYYPGDGYVDVLGVDGYNWGSTRPEYGGWQSFSQLFKGVYERLRKLGSQPIWVTEVGSDHRGGDKARWVRDMFATADGMDRLQAIVWFNQDKERDWRAAPTPAVAAAFRSGAPSTPRSARSAAATRAQPRARFGLLLHPVRRVRAGRRATLRWTSVASGRVRRWNVYVDGRRVRVVRGGSSSFVRTRVGRAGRHRFTLHGRDAGGRRIVSASRIFRVLR